MKKILIPTDLADNATDAFAYLIPLLIEQDAEIHLVHAVDDPFVKEERTQFDEQGVEKYTSDIIYKMRAEADAAMLVYAEQFRLALNAAGKPMTVFSHVENGLADEIILHQASIIQPQLLIMGRHHHSRIERLFFGTVTQSVMKKAHCPVLVLPEKYTFTKPQEVLYMSDMDAADVISIGKILNLLKPFGINLHIVHFNIHESYTEGKFFALGEQIKRDHQEVKIDYETVDADVLRDAWVQYVAHKNIDFIALTANKHSGLQRLLNQDTAADVLYHSKLPLLILHKY